MKRALAIAAIMAASFGLLGYSMPSWGADTSTSGKVTTVKPAKKTSSKRHVKKHVKSKSKSTKEGKNTLKKGQTQPTTQKQGEGSITPATPTVK